MNTKPDELITMYGNYGGKGVIKGLTRLKFGDRGFSAAAPDAWNSLPTHVKSAPSLDAFIDRLKTELFRRSHE